ncbi:MAG TPA: OmpA family protein [Bacteroidetes bacterium]|nr:OmpA family protein [Bacteroidota bacterium]
MQPCIPAVASGEYRLLHNTYFDFNEHRINIREKRELDRIAAILLEYPELKFEPAGFADPQGNTRYNLKLSDCRAQAVAGYPVSRGGGPGKNDRQGSGGNCGGARSCPRI